MVRATRWEDFGRHWEKKGRRRERRLDGGWEGRRRGRLLDDLRFRPGTWLLGMGAVMIYGFYKLRQGIQEQNELAREKMWSRIHLIPMLQAEEDRDLVRRHLADQAREKELLGENFKVYNSDRYVRPTYAVTPANVSKEK
ncbi:GRIM-19 [Xylariomycetidae sp. FL2044]|nr:GRIM-19 [Xylariomycetidae sp. FL2044]